MSLDERNTSGSAADAAAAARTRKRFGEDFRRFFLRGLAALMPTLITLWLLIKVWDFLWESLGRHIIWFISWAWLTLVNWPVTLPADTTVKDWPSVGMNALPKSSARAERERLALPVALSFPDAWALIDNVPDPE